MKTRQLGQSSIEASVIAFGAWAIGGWKWGGTDANDSIEAIRASLDAGVTLIDTAAIYGFGLSEELVGEAIKGRPRRDIVLATKCGLRWDIETPTLHAQSDGRRIMRSLTHESIRWEVEQSLSRLGTDYIDLYQTHWPDPETAPEVFTETLAELRREGRVRAIGLCNASVDDMQRAARVAPIDTDQERYSLLDRERDRDNLPFCQENDMAFLAYSPIAQGLLTGAIDETRVFAENDLRHGNPRFSRQTLRSVNQLLEPVNDLASDLVVTTEQLVLAWTLCQPGCTHALVGTRNVRQAQVNAAAGAIDLTPQQLATLNEAAAGWQGF